MYHRNGWRSALLGGLAGLVNGFFGSGGGLLLVPFLIRICKLSQRKAFATSVAIVLPLCTMSAFLYYLFGGLSLRPALPYLLGGLVGGWTGGRLFRRVNVLWLRRVFALLILFCGGRMLF